jgi:hypothetical protein
MYELYAYAGKTKRLIWAISLNPCNQQFGLLLAVTAVCCFSISHFTILPLRLMVSLQLHDGRQRNGEYYSSLVSKLQES